MPCELPAAVAYPPLARVGDVEAPAPAAHLVEHHEVILIPMQNARQWLLRQSVDTHTGSLGLKPHGLGGVFDGEQRHALGSGEAQPRERLYGAAAPVIIAYHGQ